MAAVGFACPNDVARSKAAGSVKLARQTTAVASGGPTWWACRTPSQQECMQVVLGRLGTNDRASDTSVHLFWLESSCTAARTGMCSTRAHKVCRALLPSGSVDCGESQQTAFVGGVANGWKGKVSGVSRGLGLLYTPSSIEALSLRFLIISTSTGCQ